ncbi:MAG: DUF2213 domain-containing protein [Clostridia bacterium]|nr:DUF2213 domain-containing protein [Clostridia bacterium]
MHYYGTRLSENISKREPEGYLLCLNVPVARTGTQEYLAEELGLSSGAGGRKGGLITVFRPEEEVFSPETIASFEGMPVTNDHPPEEVDIGNIRALQKGHVHNVRRGSGEESDLLLADLIITDPELIRLILEEGKREISCGYTYELCEENGRFVQRKIRGNHVAVVDAGRAGPRVSIKDHNKPVTERRNEIMKKSLSKVLARMAKDGDAETVAEIIEEMLDPAETGEEETVSLPEAAEEEKTETEETKNIIIDENSFAGILERLDRILAVLEPAAADEAVPEEAAEVIGEALENAAEEAQDPLTGEISAVMEEILDPVASAIIEVENREEAELPETLQTGDALRAALAAVRPLLVRMPRETQRKIAGDIAANLRRTGGRKTVDSDIYGVLSSASRRTAPVSADLGKRIMEKRNAAMRGKEANHRG